MNYEVEVEHVFHSLFQNQLTKHLNDDEGQESIVGRLGNFFNRLLGDIFWKLTWNFDVHHDLFNQNGRAFIRDEEGEGFLLDAALDNIWGFSVGHI